MEEITFDKEARTKLFNGVNKLERAVGSTMGPQGTTVVIPSDNYGEYKITKDGVSVAKNIFFKDPIENIGANFVKQAAEKTVDDAGDGTTTATVLVSSFINNLKDMNTVRVNKAFQRMIPIIVDQLKDKSRELKREDIKHVASISANNDLQIGDILQQAFNHASIVKVEESNNSEDRLDFVEGMSLEVSYFSKNFINNKKKAECDFEEPFVLLLDGKLENLKGFEIPIKSIAENNQSLLIVTEHVHENVLRLLETNAINGSLKVCVIKAPGFSKHRKDLLRDLSDFTGATLINDLNKSYNSSILGKLKSCKITKSNSILVKHDDVNVADIIDTLEGLLSISDIETYDKDLIKQRIENLTGKVSIIKVGGGSELEMKERKDRYDDAVLAVACALEEGIVEGGGVALSSIHRDLIEDDSLTPEEVKLVDSLLSPTRRISANGTIFKTKKDMFDQNIIDPLKVTRCALENAASVANAILSTKAVVLSRNEWN
jgi:chaperonin GroEL